jgi:hypothetical protein
VAGSSERNNEPAGFHKILGHSWVTEQLVVSQDGLGSTELILT